MTKIKSKQIQSVRGMHDILPADQKYWRCIQKKAEALVEYYGFERIETPVLEQTDLFVRTAGETSDIVMKEMYSLKTKGGDSLSLRPEGTAPVVRAYLENGMNVWPHPVKLYYVETFFRHDEPQYGRYRQQHQLGLETIGDASEAVDAELIFLAHKFVESLGIKGYNIHVNSIGDQNCRPAYMKALRDYFRNHSKKLCVQCKVRIKENVLRILDCKEESCKETAKEAPQMVDFLDEACRLHFKHVLEFLDEAQVPYILNPFLVRGLDYYTRTVFELVPDEGTLPQLSLLGGGRYDKLVEQLGGVKTPAAGFAVGLERVILAMKEQNVHVPEVTIKPKVFLVQLGEAPKRKALTLFESFRKAGIEAKSSLGRDSIKSQLRIAHRLGVRFALIFGQKEALDGTIILREMDTGVQETILLDKIVEEVKKRLKQ
ncbi:MAG: Histidine-tRNA ligase [Microgenomates group bacterium GW2011_GWA1_Microgenomates_45_10]|uniref:Histidine--tRNA ligase n=1 Tax=Candidatus Yanofskybacteria bacterium RIFCSPHIGHO2_01_FULL_48_25b TaxID=1802672 RepID=A0A1F8F280_9BACT|nr:MAG: Histidine-tRNA ligase [Microgenomates group bacterium GW2011_GWA1_Microgenomates_45_10]OGN06690.1 MAG: histidine--tRNA ligase [Candidatus Yanofskybacteria bacterium RIFCSPHIGHO2_01_FULL_48_25b]